jgi:protein-arginine kinase activator protein McsA
VEERKFCQSCKKRHIARTYTEKGKSGSLEFYCLDCYSRLFLDEMDANNSASSCPYCGMTAKEAQAGKLVGCAHCYQTMQEAVYPMIYKMQGERAHKGKTPPLDGDYGDLYDYEDTVGAEYRAKAIMQARYERQCRELRIIIQKLKSEGNFEGAKSYEEKLTAMRNRSAIEEDFVWRTRWNLSKQS